MPSLRLPTLLHFALYIGSMGCGYRPARATRAMVQWAERTGRRALLDSGYIARRSRHNLGVAVDLMMVDLETGTEVPMGGGTSAIRSRGEWDSTE
jgi:D-alanyl-D-alanine dipeptidase